MEIAELYSSTILAIGFMVLLMLCQVVVADVVGMRKKHLPGAIVPVDHDSFLFRVNRTVANTNETAVIFLSAVMFCIFSNAAPEATAYSAWGYAIARFLFTLCYYLNLQLLRSTMFAISLIGISSLLVVGALSWL